MPKVIVVNESKENQDDNSQKRSNVLITLNEDGFVDLPRILKLVQVTCQLLLFSQLVT